MRDIHAVHADRAAVDLVEAHQQIDERRLARAGWPDDGDHLPRSDVDIHVRDERHLGLVAEADMLELHRALRLRDHDRIRRIRNLLRFIEQFEDALRRGHRGLDDVRDIRELRDRHGELPRVLDERLHIADGDRAPRHHDAADDADEDVAEVADEHRHRHDDAGDELRLPARFVELAVQRVEARDGLPLLPERLDDLVARVHLLDMAVELPERPLLPDEIALRPLRDQRVERRLSGSVVSTTRASEGLMTNISTITPATVTSEVMSCVRLCCKVLLMLSMSLTARLRISPCVRESKNSQRQAREFLVHLPAHAVDRPLRHARHDELLRVAERRADDIEDDEQHEDFADIAEVDPRAPGTPRSRATIPSKSLVVARPMIFGATMLKIVLRIAASKTTMQADLLRPEVAEQPHQRAAKVLRLLGRHAHRHRAAPAEEARATGRGAGPHRVLISWRVIHAAASTPICEETISR